MVLVFVVQFSQVPTIPRCTRRRKEIKESDYSYVSTTNANNFSTPAWNFAL